MAILNAYVYQSMKRDLAMRLRIPKLPCNLALAAAFSLFFMAPAEATVIFNFQTSAEFGDSLCPREICIEEVKLRPLAATISFTDAAVLAGQATLDDIVGFTFTGGDIIFTLAQLEGPPNTVFFSPDRSSIAAFESQMFIPGLGLIPVSIWQFRTGDLRSPSLGAHMSANALSDGILFRDTLLSPSAAALGTWQAQAVPEPGTLYLCVAGLTAIGLIVCHQRVLRRRVGKQDQVLQYDSLA
jgi:hypothetical protein